ncbi:MAG: aminotransferase class V-fold PLP-dependent enzyme [Phycisphaerae bacterium]|nr:aminotransferase class V-fold PLP-dependent enzyme [Phycisphaerae bacterium]
MPVSYTFKIAAEAWEFEQIKSLNYETFAEEIPQHTVNPERILTDIFHDENTYLICVRDKQVLAMLAVRDRRPFSLDKKLDNLDAYLSPGHSLCEVRLLAARKSIRNSRIIRGLIAETVAYCLRQHYTMALISGVLEQVKLYTHLGFVPFGPVVGTRLARFQPMYLTIEAHTASKTSFIPGGSEPTNCLPGPVAVSASVRQSLAAPMLSHRSSEYLQLHHNTQDRLKQLVGTKHVQIFTGSGTLANEVVAGQLSLLPGRGLILSNGEFGERLIQEARCFGLTFEALSLPWGYPYEERHIRETICQLPELQWLWAVYSESSTGMLNDLDMLKAVANDYGLYLCLDCISAIGNTSVNFQNIYLASACSSKGLRSIAGLAIVFYNHALTPPTKPLPMYLDLYAYEKANGVPFTIPSNLVGALATALKECNVQQRFLHIASIDNWLRGHLNRLGLVPLVAGHGACPGIITLPLKKPLCSKEVGNGLKDAGFLINYESRYLLERNWIQICLMSGISKPRLRAFLEVLEQIISSWPPKNALSRQILPL